MKSSNALGNRVVKVRLCDVEPGDILYLRGTENDPIIERVEVSETQNIKLHYKPRATSSIKETIWMAPDGYIFIHNLKKEVRS